MFVQKQDKQTSSNTGNIFNENKHYKCCRSGADLERMWDEHERKEQDEESRMGGRTKIDIMYGSGVAGR